MFTAFEPGSQDTCITMHLTVSLPSCIFDIHYTAPPLFSIYSNSYVYFICLGTRAVISSVLVTDLTIFLLILGANHPWSNHAYYLSCPTKRDLWSWDPLPITVIRPAG